MLFKHTLNKQTSPREKTPWLNSEIKAKMNERDYYLRKARKSGKELGWSAYRRLSNTATRLIRNSKANYTRTVLKGNIDRPRDFWNQIKRCFPTKTGSKISCKVFKIDGEEISEKKEYLMSFAPILLVRQKNCQSW